MLGFLPRSGFALSSQVSDSFISSQTLRFLKRSAALAHVYIHFQSRINRKLTLFLFFPDVLFHIASSHSEDLELEKEPKEEQHFEYLVQLSE